MADRDDYGIASRWPPSSSTTTDSRGWVQTAGSGSSSVEVQVRPRSEHSRSNPGSQQPIHSAHAGVPTVASAPEGMPMTRCRTWPWEAPRPRGRGRRVRPRPPVHPSRGKSLMFSVTIAPHRRRARPPRRARRPGRATRRCRRGAPSRSPAHRRNVSHRFDQPGGPVGADQKVAGLDHVTAAALVSVEEAGHRRQARAVLGQVRVLIECLRNRRWSLFLCSNKPKRLSIHSDRPRDPPDRVVDRQSRTTIAEQGGRPGNPSTALGRPNEGRP